MPKITYIDTDGQRYEVDAENGTTVMENAIRNGVPGIEAECGGACACATCHVYVDEAFKEIVGEPEPMEEDMLDFAYRRPADLPALLPDPRQRRTRRAGRHGPRAPGLIRGAGDFCSRSRRAGNNLALNRPAAAAKCPPLSSGLSEPE